MTDEGSRKAFEKWENGDTVGDGYGWARAAWEASGEYHTKRERENIDTEAIAWAYAKLRNFGVIDNTMENAMMADRLMAMLQEPQP